jgi:hypothetical protein
MNRLNSSFILGYHGCSKETAASVLNNEDFIPSTNDYDWLGGGIYFWEANPSRGLEFAREAIQRNGGDPKEADVVGAVIELGNCLDLLSKSSIDLLARAHTSYVNALQSTGDPRPLNTKYKKNLDCAVISRLHEMFSDEKISIDTVRGVFIEGQPIYEGASFYEKSHIQIAVCNPACIKGVFRVPARYLG